MISIESVHGNYYVIGKSQDGYFLKNKYTEIPNEFGYYDISRVEELFKDLCERIPECSRAGYPEGHPNSCMMVTYDDGEKILYKEGTSGKNLCAYTTAVAEYSEFFTGRFFGGCSESITLEHLRHVCRTGYEDLGFLVEAIKDYIEDDYTWISERREADDAIYIDKTCYGICSKGFISVLPDKHIGNTGDLKFVELLKQQNVAIS